MEYSQSLQGLALARLDVHLAASSVERGLVELARVQVTAPWVLASELRGSPDNSGPGTLSPARLHLGPRLASLAERIVFAEFEFGTREEVLLCWVDAAMSICRPVCCCRGCNGSVNVALANSSGYS